jgi:hypothetical protein
MHGIKISGFAGEWIIKFDSLLQLAKAPNHYQASKILALQRIQDCTKISSTGKPSSTNNE